MVFFVFIVSMYIKLIFFFFLINLFIFCKEYYIKKCVTIQTPPTSHPIYEFEHSNCNFVIVKHADPNSTVRGLL